MNERSFEHQPVMADEVLELLGPERGGRFLDATLGGAGHAIRILESSSDTSLIGLDQDPEAVEAAQARLADYGERARVLAGNFREVAALLEEYIGRSSAGSGRFVAPDRHDGARFLLPPGHTVKHADGRDNRRLEDRSRLTEHGVRRRAGVDLPGLWGGAEVAWNVAGDRPAPPAGAAAHG